ncbi:YigZ family protein [Neptunicella sp. SCSIO 80796]|uniref:YigZ family protein n=1 Tax=Neptunicella plasticusilytica TaxID=3117012 RepID=UPI003A4E1B97
MSNSSYPAPAQTWQTELDIKRSKFLSFAANAASREEAEQFIRFLREQHPQANHVCWAYIAGAPDTTVRSMSDDGEPSGTAGMPMLKVLQHSGLGDIVVAVVRYFGGTKLGTGGLQRAYSDAVTQVLGDLPTRVKVSRTLLTLRYDYTHDGAITRLLDRYDVADIHTDYGQQVVVNLAVARTEVDVFKTELVNLTAGSINIIAPNSP